MERRPVEIALIALLALVAGCETPEHNDSSEASGEAPSANERAADESGVGSESEDEAFDFEPVPAAASEEREALLYAAPEKPRALLWVFHGRGDSREICRRAHLKRAIRVFYRAGFAVVCPQSLDRSEESWTGGTTERAGADIANIRHARTHLRSSGSVPADLPEFGWGISNGGRFVGTWAYHESSAGVDVRGIECMVARCRDAVVAGEEFGLHVHWAAAKDDPFFAFSGVRDTHRTYDGSKSFTVAEPAPLTTARLQSFAELPTSGARELRRALNGKGLLDDDGLPSCDPKASSACRKRLFEVYRSVDPDAPRSMVRHAYENCRATHMAFHTTCNGDDNTTTVLEAFRGQL